MNTSQHSNAPYELVAQERQLVDIIYNEDCFDTMARMSDGMCNVVLTSPFYNTSRNIKTERAFKHHEGRYDVFVDSMTDEEYCYFTARLFTAFDRILSPNGVVLYNINYGCENRDGMFKAINSIVCDTPFTIADVISWKKRSALPNNVSPNKLTRITEFVFVFCRRDEEDTFFCNKPVAKENSKQTIYRNIFNFIEAANNDGSCDFHKATYSTELCTKLLDIYAPPSAVVYDPFMGTGTTAVAALMRDLHYVGSDISERYCDFARQRIEQFLLSGRTWSKTPCAPQHVQLDLFK